MNAAIEFHDSDLQSVTRLGSTVLVEINAYVHRSSGVPGIDPGQGFMQNVELEFSNAEIVQLPTAIPEVLFDGLVDSDVEYQGLIPIPFKSTESVTFEAECVSGQFLRVCGSSLKVSPVSDAVYVEDFPGHSPA